MGNIDYSALFHHFCQVPVAEGISVIPMRAEQDDVFFEAVSFEVDHACSI